MDFINFSRKKLFTLIELIVVIVVLGILAAIVIPNTTNFQGEANKTAAISNARNIQTAVDMFSLRENGKLPTIIKPTIGNPQTIEFYALKPKYLKDIPKTKNVHYWLDYKNIVWASTVDAPTDISFEEDKLTWKTVDGAELYKIYSYKNKELVSTVNIKEEVKDIDLIKSTSNIERQELELPKLENDKYLVSAVDMYGLETPPIIIGTSYSGYIQPNKDFNLETLKLPYNEMNKKPMANFSFSPNSSLYRNTVINFIDTSTDENGDIIQNKQWKIDNNVVINPPTNFSLGKHKISLRVQDQYGLWSDWNDKEINIINQAPTPIITLNPSSNLNPTTKLIWGHENSSDGDGDTLINNEWKLNGTLVSSLPETLPVGTHKVELRVQDSENTWSNWIEKTVTIVEEKIITSTAGKSISLTPQYSTSQLGSFTIPSGAKNIKVTFSHGQNMYGFKMYNSTNTLVYYFGNQYGSISTNLVGVTSLGGGVYQLKNIQPGNTYSYYAEATNGNGYGSASFSGFKIEYNK